MTLLIVVVMLSAHVFRSVQTLSAHCSAPDWSSPPQPAAANQASSATTRLVDNLREIGPPDTESGQAAQQQLQQVGDSIERHATKARDLVESGSSSGAGLVATARSVLVEIGAAADEVKGALSSLQQAGEDIRSGTEASDACSQLRDRDFASG